MSTRSQATVAMQVSTYEATAPRGLAALQPRPPRRWPTIAQTVGLHFVGAALLLAALGPAVGAAEAGPPAWDTAPLEVRVWVAVVPDAEFTPQWQARLREQMGARLARFLGAAARVKIEDAPDAAHRGMLASLESFSAETIPAEQSSADKTLLLRVQALPNAYELSAREYDAATRALGPVVRRRVWQWAEVSPAACRSAEQSFRPLARLETASVRRLVLLGQAGVELTRQMREELLARLRGWAHGRASLQMELRVSAAAVDLQRVQVGTQRVDGLPAEAGAFDEVLVVVVRSDEGKLCAELHAYTQWPAAVKVLPLCQVDRLDALPDALGGGLDQAWEEVGKPQRVRRVLRLRAGANREGSPALGEIGPGSLFQPVVRTTGPAGSADSTAAVPWTFCVVQEPGELDQRRGEWPARVESGLKNPLPAPAPPGVEVLALAVNPPGASTRLVLRTTGASAGALAGVGVYAAGGRGAEPDLLGRTDRQGALGVGPGPQEDALRILLVGGADGFLARLPIVPGLQSELVAVLPVEEGQLLLEALLAGLRNDVIDVATRREVLLTRAELYQADGQTAEARQILEQIHRLPAREEMLRRLAELQGRSTPADAAARSRLEAQVAETRKLIETALDPKPVEQLAKALEGG